MATIDQGIHLEIDGDGSSGQSAAQGVSTSLNSLDETVAKLNATLGQLNLSAKTTADSITNVGTHAKVSHDELQRGTTIAGGLGAAFDQIGEHGRTLAIALDGIGLQTAGATAKVVAGADAMTRSFGAVHDPLIAVAAGLVAVAGSAIFLDDAIKKAGEWTQSLMLLGVTVKNQGGDWDVLKGKVQEFADLQERTTTFSRIEVVESLREMTKAGIDVGVAMQSVRIAEDASIATGNSLEQITNALTQAHRGYSLALRELGIGTKASIKDGMSYNEILTLIEKNMGNMAFMAANTVPGAWKQLVNSFSKFEEDAGTPFQGAIVEILHDLADLVVAIEHDTMPYIEEFAKWFTDNLPQIESTAKTAFEDIGNAIHTAATFIGAFVNFLEAHSEAVEYFFGTVIAIKAAQAIIGLIANLKDLAIAEVAMDAWSGFTLIVEAAAGAISSGLIPAIRAAITAMYDLAGAEAVASLGITAAVAAAILAVDQLATHQKEDGDFMVQKIDDLIRTYDDFEKKVDEAMRVLIGWIPGVQAYADAMDNVANQATAAANAIDKVSQAQSHADTAAQISKANTDLEKAMIADPKYYGLTAAQVQSMKDDLIASGQLNPANPITKDTGAGVAATSHGGGQPFQPILLSDDNLKQIDQVKVAQDKLDNSLKMITESEVTYKNAVELSTTAQEQESAKMSLAQKQDEDLAAKRVLLNNAVYEGEQKETQLTDAVAKSNQAYKDAVATYNAHQEAMAGLKKRTSEQEAETRILKTDVDNAKKSYDLLSASLKENTTDLTKNKDALQLNKDTISEVAKAQDAALRAYNDNLQKSKQAMIDEEATYGQSLAVQMAYWQARLAAVKGNGQLELEMRAEIIKKEQDLEISSYKTRMDAYNTFIQNWTTIEKGWLDNILTGQTNLRDSLKTIWKDILNQYVQMLEQMVLKSEVFSQINKLFMGIFNINPSNAAFFGSTSKDALLGGGGGGGDTVAGAMSGAMSYGLLGAFTGTTGAAQIIASLPSTSGGIAGGSGISSVFDFGGIAGSGGGSNLSSILTGGSTDVGGAVGNAASGASGGLGGLGGSGSGAGGLFGPGGLLSNMWNSKGLFAGKTFGSGTLGSLAIGVGVGALLGSLQGGNHSTWGMIGGALGSLFGPVGGAIGGAIGSLFGHKDDPSAMPDKYDTARFTQIIGELQGSAGTGYGPSYDPGSDQVQQSLGMPMIPYIQQWIAANLQSSDPKKQALAQKLNGAWGTSGGGLNFAHDIANVSVQGGSESGNYVDVWNAASDAVTQIQALTGNSATSTPVFSVTHPLPDYAGAQVTNVGNYTPGAPGAASGGGSAGGGTVVGGGGLTGPGTMQPGFATAPAIVGHAGVSSAQVGGVNVQVTVQGSVTSDGDLANKLASIIAGNLINPTAALLTQ